MKAIRIIKSVNKVVFVMLLLVAGCSRPYSAKPLSIHNMVNGLNILYLDNLIKP